MSTNLSDRRNVGALLTLIVATLVVLVAGTGWLRGQGEALVVEVAYAALVLIAALVVYDKLLVQ